MSARAASVPRFYIGSGGWEDGRFICGLWEVRPSGNFSTGLRIAYAAGSSIAAKAQREAVEAASDTASLAKVDGVFPLFAARAPA